MATLTAEQYFSSMDEKYDSDSYNFEHFGLRELWLDVKQILTTGGIRPGEIAPDFELPAVGGGTVRLKALRDKPVLLHFGSYT